MEHKMRAVVVVKADSPHEACEIARGISLDYESQITHEEMDTIFDRVEPTKDYAINEED